MTREDRTDERSGDVLIRRMGQPVDLHEIFIKQPPLTIRR